MISVLQELYNIAGAKPNKLKGKRKRNITKETKKGGRGRETQKSTLEKILQGFEEKRSHFRARRFDCTLQPGDSNYCCEFNQERDSSRDLRREVQHVLVCVLTFCDEEHVGYR